VERTVKFLYKNRAIRLHDTIAITVHIFFLFSGRGTAQSSLEGNAIERKVQKKGKGRNMKSTQ